MSQVTLLIQPSDIISLTTLDGNIDVDNLKPMIFIAQTTHLKSFLGLKLYDKIYTDFVANTLSGVYLTIYEDFIKDFLSYYTSALFVNFGGYKVSENGLYKISSEGLASLDSSETKDLHLQYLQLVSNVESNFKEFIKENPVIELQDTEIKIDTTFPWL